MDTLTSFNELITELEQIYTDDYETLAVMKSIRRQVEAIYTQACEVGQTFRFCRIGEDHPEATKMRLELDAPYTKLAKLIDQLYMDVTGEDIPLA